jgi:hypothetical protein
MYSLGSWISKKTEYKQSKEKNLNDHCYKYFSKNSRNRGKKIYIDFWLTALKNHTKLKTNFSSIFLQWGSISAIVITLKINDFCPPEICLSRELSLTFCTEELQLCVGTSECVSCKSIKRLLGDRIFLI